jgi:hypothetical protein
MNSDVPDTNVLPRARPVSSAIRKGSTRAQRRLSSLGFCPINELVEQYHHLKQERARQLDKRGGEVVELDTRGNTRNFRFEDLAFIEAQLFNISKELLRYGYGRAPETPNDNANKSIGLSITMTNSKQDFMIKNEERFTMMDQETDIIDMDDL